MKKYIHKKNPTARLVCALLCCAITPQGFAQFIIGLAQDDEFMVPAETETTLDVLANDHTVTQVYSIELPPELGQAWVTDDQRIVLQTAAGVSEPFEFHYTATNADYEVSYSATVAIKVKPNLLDDAAFAVAGEPLLVEVMNNDSGGFRPEWISAVPGLSVELLADGTVRVLSHVPGQYLVHYGAAEASAQLTVYVRAADAAAIPGEDISVHALADAEAVDIPIALLFNSATVVKHGAYGTTELAAANRIRYRPSVFRPGQDQFEMYRVISNNLQGGELNWSRQIVTVHLDDPNLQHYFDFDTAPPALQNTVLNQGRSEVNGAWFNGGALLIEPPRFSADALRGAGALDLSANDATGVVVAAPVHKEAGALSVWLNIPADRLKHGTENNEMTVAAFSANAVDTQWDVTLVPSSLDTGVFRLRAGDTELHSEMVWFNPGWHHFALAWSQDESGGRVQRMSLNGRPIAEADANDPLWLPVDITDGSHFILGNRFECLSSDCGASFGGLLDEFKLYDETLDPSAWLAQYTQQNPHLQFQLKADDITQKATVNNAVSMQQSIALEQIHGAPYKVRSDHAEIGLMFSDGGGHLRWALPEGHLNPHNSWLAWTIQLPDEGLHEDVILLMDESERLRIALQNSGDGLGRLIVQNNNETLLMSDELTLPPGQSLDVQVLWTAQTATAHMNEQLIAHNSFFNLDYSVLNAVLVPMAPGVSLWAMQYGEWQDSGDGGLTDTPVQNVQKTVVNAMYIPEIRLINHPDEPYGFRWLPGHMKTHSILACKNNVPEKLSCQSRKSIALLAKEHDANRSLQKNLVAHGTPMKAPVYWWNRFTEKLHNKKTGASYTDILKTGNILVTQMQGTGDRNTRVTGPTGDKMIMGITLSAWTGLEANGSVALAANHPFNNIADLACSATGVLTDSWSTNANTALAVIGDHRRMDKAWMNGAYIGCDANLVVRCTCPVEVKQRKIEKLK